MRIELAFDRFAVCYWNRFSCDQRTLSSLSTVKSFEMLIQSGKYWNCVVVLSSTFFKYIYGFFPGIGEPETIAHIEWQFYIRCQASNITHVFYISTKFIYRIRLWTDVAIVPFDCIQLIFLLKTWRINLELILVDALNAWS